MLNVQPAMGISRTPADAAVRLPTPPDGSEKTRTDAERLRIFAAFSHVEWGNNNLEGGLGELGEVIRFRWDFAAQNDPDWHRAEKSRMNQEMLDALGTAHRERPVDVFFGCLSGRTVFPGYIREINRAGIRTLNISLDDKDHFIGPLEATGHAGMIDIASAFSLNWTSSEETLPQYESAGARVIYLPQGANPQVYKPANMSLDLDVSFVGQRHDQRAEIINDLSNRGISVETFGKGWPSDEISEDEMIRVINRSRINLCLAPAASAGGFSGLRGRDFKIPMSGGLYFTPYRRELGDVYAIGREIVCYHTTDDLAEKIKFYLSHPDKAEEIRRAGQRRAYHEHTWSQRFRQAFRALGVVVPGCAVGTSLLKTRKQRRVQLRASANGM